jgi:hypothetical protein
LIATHWRICLAALAPIFIFSQIWIFFFNFVHFGGWLGSVENQSMAAQDNVLLGGLANLVRYFFQSIHFTAPLEYLAKLVFGFSLTEFLMKTYNLFFDPIFGMSGAAEPFSLLLVPDGRHSWFGPFGMLFVVPSIIIAILRGHRRLKAIALALAGYVYVTALVVPWTAGNVKYFTVVFACGGFCVSYLLPPWRFTKTGKKVLQVMSILLLFYACLFNIHYWGASGIFR